MSVIADKIRALRSAWMLSRSQALASRHDFEGALGLLSKTALEDNDTVPSINRPIIENVLYASASQNAGHGEIAYKACKIALYQLDRAENDDFYKEFDKNDLNYLRYVCKWVLTGTSKFSNSIAWELAKTVKLGYNKVNFKSVNRKIRKAFPITEQEGAEFDLFFRNNL